MAAFLDAHASRKELERWPKTKTRRLCTSAEELACFRDNGAVGAYLDYRRPADLLSKFGEGLAAHAHPVTRRLHLGFRIGGAKTGRFSSSGPNVQGLPREREFRSLFVPESGNVIVRADYNQMQLRIAGLLSGDASLLGSFESEHDVHRLTAARVLGKSVEGLAEGDREKAKAIGFGILFGMGATSLQTYARSDYGAVMSQGCIFRHESASNFG